MSHVHYEEEQRFSQVGWIWILSIFIILAPFVVILMDEKSNGENAVLTVLTALAAWIPVGIILFIARFQLKINEAGLHYRFLPRVFKWKIIDKARIDSFEIQEKKGILDRMACGYRRNIFKNTIFMNVTGKKFLIIRLTDGVKLKIGSQNAETMEWALKRLLRSKEEK